MPLIIPDWPAPERVRAFSTVRSGGYSPFPYHGSRSDRGGLNVGLHVGDDPEKVRLNRAKLRRYLPSEPVWLNQVHGSVVVDAARVGGVPDADASYTRQNSVVCAVMTADCLPVLFCTADGKTVAAAHAGWRGLASGVLEKTIEAMRPDENSRVLAWLGPAIGPENFEVGEDVLTVFAEKNAQTVDAFVEKRDVPGKYLANIYLLATRILAKAGVSDIFGGRFCTVSDKKRFYSYRRDGVTGRMATGIWIAAE